MFARVRVAAFAIACLAPACADTTSEAEDRARCEVGSGQEDGCEAAALQQASARYQRFLLQTGTALHESGTNFDFLIANNRDLFAIKKSATTSGKTEVHILSAASGYQSFSFQGVTGLTETGSDFEFALAANRDLVVIKKRGTGTRSTEVHVLSAASNYRQFVLQTGTALQETDHTFEFELAANRDLYVIQKSGTGTGSTEVHVLSAASNYQSFSFHGGTALHETDATFTFLLASNNDLFAIKKRNTESASTEVHVLAAGTRPAARYAQFSLQTGTALHETGDNFAFALTANRDLAAIKKSDTGTGSTELNIL